MQLFIVLCVFYAVVESTSEFTVLTTFRHDARSFTQGLEYYNGWLYESSGMYGSSSLQILHPDTGIVQKRIMLDKKYFGEGITIVNGRVYMLTWKEKTMLIFDAHSLDVRLVFCNSFKYVMLTSVDMTYHQLLGSVTYTTHTGEGWGIAFDGTHLVVSDGSEYLTFFELPTHDRQESLHRVREVPVVDTVSNRHVRRINELEIINGYIYTNIWYLDVILKIDPHSGKVLHTYDFRDLFPAARRPRSSDCFNGIAYNTTDRTVTLTGKYWPKMYRVSMPL